MAVNLYVGNLPYRIDEDSLRQLFTPYGNVETSKVIKDRQTGRSKGFGFIEMASQAEAEAAIKALNETAAGRAEPEGELCQAQGAAQGRLRRHSKRLIPGNPVRLSSVGQQAQDGLFFFRHTFTTRTTRSRSDQEPGETSRQSACRG